MNTTLNGVIDRTTPAMKVGLGNSKLTLQRFLNMVNKHKLLFA